MCTTDKVSVKMCLKAIRDTFVCNQGRDGVRQEGKEGTQFFGGCNIQKMGEVQNFGYKWGEPSIVPLLVANPDPP